jgi:hypothetical protein
MRDRTATLTLAVALATVGAPTALAFERPAEQYRQRYQTQMVGAWDFLASPAVGKIRRPASRP